MPLNAIQRRDFLRLSAAGLSTVSLSGWFPRLAAWAQQTAKPPQACILLWMPGGPSQIDTFDPKPSHENGGEFAAIDTSVPGIQISEHLPLLAEQAQELAIIRSMQTKEGDHGRATYHLRTGYRPQGPVQYPTLGSLVSHRLKRPEVDLPGYVSILSAPFANPGAFRPGFLGPEMAPLIVGGDPRNNRVAADSEYGAPLEVRNVAPPEQIAHDQLEDRLGLLDFIETSFSADRPGLATRSHQLAYAQAVRMMNSPAMSAFDLEEEPANLRSRYGKNRFGQACLLARRLIERGVSFVEIGLSSAEGDGPLGWDTHQNNFEAVRNLSQPLDAGWATLLVDLRDRGLLDSTLVIWMGEFGRTPKINGNGGRDHFPTAWSTVLAGGGIRGGQTYGATNEAGTEVSESPVPVNNFFATICSALGLDPTDQNMSNVGRPIRLVEPEAQPIAALL